MIQTAAKIQTFFRQSAGIFNSSHLHHKCRKSLVFKGKRQKMVARAGATRRAKPDEEPERSDGNPHTVSIPFFDQRKKTTAKRKNPDGKFICESQDLLFGGILTMKAKNW